MQASRCHSSLPRNGCGHTPLELYDRVEVGLRWADARSRNRWIRQPSRELGIDGFDDLRCEEVPIAEYVQDRVQALRDALVARVRSQGGQVVAAREPAVEPDHRPTDVEPDIDASDLSSSPASVQREAGLT